MQPLDDATADTSMEFRSSSPDDADASNPTDSDCVSLVLETILLGMRMVRRAVRNARPQEISVPQFRVLTHLNHHKGASLSHLAEQSGLALPSMSRAVDHLVKQGLVSRESSDEDRRRVMIQLTREGQSLFDEVDAEIKSRIAGPLADLSVDEQSDVARGIRLLRSALERGRQADHCCRPSDGPC